MYYNSILVTATFGLILCGEEVASQAKVATVVGKHDPSANYTSLLVADNDTSIIYGENQGNSPVSRKKRIVYGEIVDDFDYPYVVSLRVRGSHVCGGTILTPRLILTAAHCIERKHGRRRITDVVVTVSRDDKKSYRVSDRIPHPWFQRNGKGALFHDVGLLLLKKEIEDARTVSLQSRTGNAAGNSQAQALGWGVTEYGYTSEQLRKVKVPLLFPSQCQRHQRGEWVCVDSSRSGTCKGDSGGPLMYDGKQIGITSFGASSDDDEVPCMTGKPSVFTRITSYYNWIHQYVQLYP